MKSRVGLYFMVFIIFLNSCSNHDVDNWNNQEKVNDQLNAKIDKLTDLVYHNQNDYPNKK